MEKQRRWIWDENNNANLAWFEVDNFPVNSILFNGDVFVSPVHNNGQIIEGATQQEQEQAELEKVPKMINQRQMKLQMLYDGISETSILAVINAIPDETLKGKILVEWQYANYFERFNENLIALWLQLDKTESELNTFFINASQL